MGTALAEGRFGLTDEAAASAWMTLAAEQGLQLAKTNLEVLEKHLKPEQRSSAAAELERLRTRIRVRAERGASPENKTGNKAPRTQ